VKLQGEQEL